MPRTATLSATEFKAKCLELLDRLADRRLEEITITKRGRPVAVLRPPAMRNTDQLHGFMRGSVVLPPNLDLTEPASDEPFDADLGLLHR